MMTQSPATVISPVSPVSPVSRERARNYNSLTLAFLGDCVYELLVRRRLVSAGEVQYKHLHARSVEKVRASYQAAGARLIEPLLSEEELGVLKRGRNAKSPVPKSASVGDYRLATGLESLFGYLSLIGDDARIDELFEVIWSAGRDAPDAP
jgi:ribonuclease-3 family protein